MLCTWQLTPYHLALSTHHRRRDVTYRVAPVAQILAYAPGPCYPVWPFPASQACSRTPDSPLESAGQGQVCIKDAGLAPTDVPNKTQHTVLGYHPRPWMVPIRALYFLLYHRGSCTAPHVSCLLLLFRLVHPSYATDTIQAASRSFLPCPVSRQTLLNPSGL